MLTSRFASLLPTFPFDTSDFSECIINAVTRLLAESDLWLRSTTLCSECVNAMSAYGDLAASGEIRLLKLDNVQPDSDLSGTLCVAILSDLPCFYAISYMWGSPVDSKQISINGTLYTIRKNLWECVHALMQNFEHLRGAWLWVDALCIRQDCVEEKNQQVAQIHHVFAGADRVYAWLGNDPLVEQSLSCFQTSLSTLLMERETYRRDVVNMFKTGSTRPPKVDTKPWESVAFCAYFTRTWIVQECALAKALTFVCGRATWTVGSNDLLPRVCRQWALQRLLFFRYWLHICEWDGPERLVEIIWGSRTAVCEEPRDMVYALQSIAIPGTRCAVDYSIAQCDLFWQVVLADGGGGLKENEVTNLQKALKASWDDITSAVESMDPSRAREPSINVESSFRRPRLARPLPELPAIVDKADNIRMVVFQRKRDCRKYQGLKAFHLMYGVMEDDNTGIIVEYGCNLLIITRASEEDERLLKLCGIALQADAEGAEREIKVLEELWEPGIELFHDQGSDEPFHDSDIKVRVSPLFLDALHKIGRHTGELERDISWYDVPENDQEMTVLF